MLVFLSLATVEIIQKFYKLQLQATIKTNVSSRYFIPEYISQRQYATKMIAYSHLMLQ